MRLSELDYRARRLQTMAAMQQAAPVDPLSKSLWEHGAYLASLDDADLMAEGTELGISLEDMRRMSRDCAPPAWRTVL